MILNFFQRFDSLFGVVLNALVDEVSCILRIVLVWLLDDSLDLLLHHFVTYLVLMLTSVRSLPNHTLVSNNA